VKGSGVRGERGKRWWEIMSQGRRREEGGGVEEWRRT